MIRIVIAALLAVHAIPAAAQIEVDETQRCVWGCLANFGPATNPAYHQCVEDHCVGDPAPKSNSTSNSSGGRGPSTTWRSGTIDDGRTVYAGVDNKAGTLGLYYFCDRAGRSEILLAGLHGPAARMVLAIDGNRFPMRFQMNGNDDHFRRVSPNAPVMAALKSGKRVRVRNESVAVAMRLRLKGSSQAIERAVRQCR